MTRKTSGATSPILLAFSGGLDTSFLVPWLRETYAREVITLTVDTGGIDAAAARVLEQRSRELGAIRIGTDASTVEVAGSVAAMVAKVMKGKTIRGEKVDVRIVK